MKIGEYQTEASRTIDDDVNPLIIAIGLAGEVGEALEHVKKHYGHGMPLDRAAFAKELGDVLWYLSALAEVHDLSLEQIAKDNIAKLKARWPEGFKRGIK